VTFTDPGQYRVTLQVTGDGGVRDSSSADDYVRVYEQPRSDFTFSPPQVFIPTDPIICTNFSKGENLSFIWDFGDGTTSNARNPEHYYLEEGLYTITLIAKNDNCSDTAVALSPVEAKPTGDVRVPNAFSPSETEIGSDGGVRKSNTGDGINDAFFPKVTGELKDYEFLVFNKWGEMLFRTRERDIGWTGWYRHEPCQQDVYVYKVKALKIDNSEVVLVGDITLLR
jgi:gliding motility-associated-like protein